MMLRAKNGTVPMGDTVMDYAVFGSGEKIIVMIPGLNDALQSVRGMAWPVAFAYRKLARAHTVYLFSRKRTIPAAYPSRDMAGDLAAALRSLGIAKAHVIGVSQGGTIAQYLAIDHPDLVDRLVLTVTYPRVNELVRDNLTHWLDLARQDNFPDLFVDITEKAYTEKSLKRMRLAYPLLTHYRVYKTWDRFITMATACVTHDAYDLLPGIACPTLIIGGTEDRIVGADASRELAARISGSQLHLYEGLGHAAYEEAKDFQQRVLDFLDK